MKSSVFNTSFENMLRIMVLMDVVGSPINTDRLTALDFICIYGKKCRVLSSNLHGNNEFGFAEFTNKRKKISEAIKIAVKNDYVTVLVNENGLVYSLNDRGKNIVIGLESTYAIKYKKGAKIIVKRFNNFSDDSLLQYINNIATDYGEV
ncbi:ABC-three component system middle component 2 [Catenibacterium mitsuokai]|uniref:ABC-three component system middle component 2 n=1 Tax=Catenibacterium mitsuokai TaxID=100886 RepID=UPI003F8F9CAC